MTEPAYPDPAAGADSGTGSERGPTPGMPRWVKVFLLVIAIALVTALVVLLSGVEHGPGLHGP